MEKEILSMDLYDISKYFRDITGKKNKIFLKNTKQ